MGRLRCGATRAARLRGPSGFDSLRTVGVAAALALTLVLPLARMLAGSAAALGLALIHALATGLAFGSIGCGSRVCVCRVGRSLLGGRHFTAGGRGLGGRGATAASRQGSEQNTGRGCRKDR